MILICNRAGTTQELVVGSRRPGRHDLRCWWDETPNAIRAFGDTLGRWPGPMIMPNVVSLGSLDPAGQIIPGGTVGCRKLVPHSRPGDPQPMDSATHNTIVNFVWGIADDVLRDLY